MRLTHELRELQSLENQPFLGLTVLVIETGYLAHSRLTRTTHGLSPHVPAVSTG